VAHRYFLTEKFFSSFFSSTWCCYSLIFSSYFPAAAAPSGKSSHFLTNIFV
jgi:hypothetical protein